MMMPVMTTITMRAVSPKEVCFGEGTASCPPAIMAPGRSTELIR